MSWPRATDYQEAMQFPAVSLCDPKLVGTQVDSGPLGLPRAISGNFASVYPIHRDGERWALRCFLVPSEDRQDRYHIIARHLARRCPPCLSTFDFLPEGVLVHGQRYPALRMLWIEGRTLSSWIGERITQPAAIARLEVAWLELLKSLKRARIAHGDLQHGNIIVCPDGRLHLIDYDGMWVPGLSGRFATELGHPNYQAPSRDASQFHGELDGFSGRLIHISLRAIARHPQLWGKYHNEGNLIFTRDDLLAPEASPLFEEIASLRDKALDREVALLLRELRKARSPALRVSPPSRTLHLALAAAAVLLLGFLFWVDSRASVEISPIPVPLQHKPAPLPPKSPEQLAAESRAHNFHAAFAKADLGFLGTYAAAALTRLNQAVSVAESRAAAGEWQAASSTWDTAVSLLADAISDAVASSARIAPPVSRPRPPAPPSPGLSPGAQAANTAADAYDTLLAEIEKEALAGAPWYFAQQTAQAAEVAHAAGNHEAATRKWREATKMLRALAPKN